MLLTLLHELVDFNLFVPANLVYFAFFAGVFFYPWEEPPKPVRARNTEVMAERSRPQLRPVGEASTQRNPFMDDE